MLELLSRLTPSDLAGVLVVLAIIGLVFLVALAKLIAYSVRRYHERQLATSLILEMLDRGMTADDIVRVLSAAGMEDQGEEVLSQRQRLREKLGRFVAGLVKPAAKP